MKLSTLITPSATVRNLLMASVAGLALAACGSSGTTTTTNNDDDVVERGDVTTGTATSDASGNGLPFSTGGNYYDADTEGVSKYLSDANISVIAVKLVADGKDLDPGQKIDSADVSLIELKILNFQLVGETKFVALFDLGDGDKLLVESDGSYDKYTSVNGVEYWVGYQNIGSDNVFAFSISTEDTGLPDLGSGGGDWDLALIGGFIGLETNPDLLDYKAATTYEGSFGIDGVNVTEDKIFEMRGDIALNADFASGEITEGLLDDFGGGDFFETDKITFDGVISGNGWTASTGDGTFKDYDGGITSGDIQLDGVFYGATGEETAGTIMMDVTLTEGEDDEVFVGAGGFIAVEVEE